MALGNIYEITLFASIFGQDADNVFHYVQTSSGAGDATDLLGVFQSDVAPLVREIQSDQVETSRMLCKNLAAIADNSEVIYLPALASDLALVSMPSFIAWEFRSLRPDLSKRYSYKRFAGVPTAQVNGNSILTSGALTVSVNDLEDAMAAPISAGGSIYAPCQIRKVKVAGVWTYSVNYTITAWQFTGDCTTQNRRKPGHGG